MRLVPAEAREEIRGEHPTDSPEHVCGAALMQDGVEAPNPSSARSSQTSIPSIGPSLAVNHVCGRGLIADMRTRGRPTIHVNSALESIKSYASAEAIGKNCPDLPGSDRLTLSEVTEIGRARSVLANKNRELAELTEILTARTMALADAARLARMGMWSVDFEPHRIFWSPEIYAILGHDPSTFTLDVDHIRACVHPEDRDAFRDGYRRIIMAGIDTQREYRIVRPSGEVRTLRELSRPKLDGKRTLVGLAGVVQDITEQKLANDALLRSEKLKTIGQITGGLAHDFNNLLSVIGLNVEAVIEADHLPPDLRELLLPAAHATRRSAELTGQLLSYARRQSLQPRSVDLRSLVDTMQPLLIRAVGGRGSLTINASHDDRRVEIDPGQFENALMNLVINARDALAENAISPRIDVSIKLVTLRQQMLALPDSVPAGTYVRVRVSDSGSGIPPDILPRIFEPFFTTKEVGSGSGLGLSMVYGFVQQSRGAMTVTSAVGHGTVIDLYFPQATAGAPAARPAVRTQRFDGQQRRVVVVEDGEDLRKAMMQIFQRMGFETVAVASADEALSVLRTQSQFDLLFSDISMPGTMNGLKLAETAKEIRPELVVVLTSGNTSEIEMCDQNWDLLPKPFRVSALNELLSKLWN